MVQPYERLEQEWAAWNHLDPQGMVVCSSGTAALHLALEALQLQAGSEVIVPDFNMIAVPRAVAMAGLTPVFVDCGDDLLMDTSILARGYTAKTAAIIYVGIYGRVCENDRQYITDVCRDKQLKFVEDLAEAHGVRPHSRTDAACWSFYKNKIVHGEEGGAVWFKDVNHAERARQLRSLGFTEAHDFNHIPRGHNYRMSNVHAQLIGENLLNVWNETHARRRWEGIYNFHCPDEWRMPPRQAPWVYDVRIPGLSSEQQTTIVKTLNQQGIAARHSFKPMSRQKEFQFCKWYSKGKTSDIPGSIHPYTNADTLSQEVAYFPLVGITAEDIQACFDTCHLVTGAPSYQPTAK